MRFRCFVGIIFLLIVEKSECAMEASCTADTSQWILNDEVQNLKTCNPAIDEVDDEDFSISSESDPTMLGFSISNKAGVKCLPTKLFTAFPELVAFQVWKCTVSDVNENHFKGLSKLKSLNLANNKIENVASDAFIDLVSLESLALSENRIHVLGKNTFASLKALKEIYFDDNEIQFLHPNIFDSLVNVEYVRLDANEILSLDEKIFKNLGSLRKIILIKNKLERIPKNLFKNNLKLEEISLNDNRMTFIGASMFDHLTYLDYVDLTNNVCIDEKYYDSNFDEMRNDLRQNCGEDLDPETSEYTQKGLE